MKAAFFMGPNRLEMHDTADPPLPDDGIIVQVKACGICGSDLRRWKESPAHASGT